MPSDTPSTATPVRVVVSLCRSCGARIVWGQTNRGKRIPIDLDSIPGAEPFSAENASRPPAVRFDPLVHTTHFATCPQADEHRRR